MNHSFAERLAKLQAKHHRGLAGVIATLNEHDANDFAVAIRAILAFTSIRPVEMGDGLSVSEATISRWASGQVAPHPLVRRIARDWMVRELNQRADMLEAFPGELGTPHDEYLPRRYRPLEELSH